MHNTREEAVIDSLARLIPKMAEADKIALVAFAEASVKQNPKPQPVLTLVQGRRYGSS